MRTSSMTGVLLSLGEFEAVLDRLDDALQIGTRIEQPNLRFHGEGVACAPA